MGAWTIFKICLSVFAMLILIVGAVLFFSAFLTKDRNGWIRKFLKWGG